MDGSALSPASDDAAINDQLRRRNRVIKTAMAIGLWISMVCLFNLSDYSLNIHKYYI